MKIKCLLIVSLFSFVFLYAQDDNQVEDYDPVDRYDKDLANKKETSLIGSLADYNFFSDAIDRNINLYKVNSQVAYERKDLERARFLYDSLVQNCLKGTQFDNFIVNKAKSGDPVYFESFEKPIYLKTIATWCEPNESEAAAFNDIANEFGDLIDFVVLYWEPKEKVLDKVQYYDSNVSVVYVDEQDNFSSDIVRRVKHSLGLPSVFLMDRKRTILNVKKGIAPEFTAFQYDERTRFGEFNSKDSKDHFVKSYTEYFDDMVEDISSMISKM
ncbi:TlpA family protein disulfide reductase [Aquimarina agarivorans]|uniref:TlpA family protein disulfide reductase n=1 Tax=Aquimarina agarivorans TaxID=980584 RepID=UPI000B9AE0B7|nr:thiol-disulfide isomerase [Aquimarina agarivorans]